MQQFKTSKALVLSTRSIGENKYILNIFTQEQGKHAGVLKQKTCPDIGSIIDTRWQARLSEQIGSFYLENQYAFSALFLDSRKRLACLSSICFLLEKLLPERHAYPDLYAQTFSFLNHLEKDDFLSHYVKWELNLLEAIGFGLDLSSCAGGGDCNTLAFVSPNTGRAVSYDKGLPYQDKLLKLPLFLYKNTTPTQEDIKNGLYLTGYFLVNKTDIKQMPLFRASLI